MTFHSLDEITPKEIMPGFHGRFIHSEAMTVAHWEIDAGSVLPMHSHPQEMIINLMNGELELTVGDESRTLVSGDVVVIPGDVPHGGKAITDCQIIDVWHPPRDDYQND